MEKNSINSNILNFESSGNEENEKKEENENNNNSNKKIDNNNGEEKLNSSKINSNKKHKNSFKINHKLSTQSNNNIHSSFHSEKNNKNNNSLKSIEYDSEELKKRIKLLEEKASNLEKKNIYYYNILKRNINLNYNKKYNDPIEEYINIKRYRNLNGYNHLMIDINKKINDFIEDEEIRDREKILYYNRVNELKDDIDYRIKVMALLQEKERQKEIERSDKDKNFYIINYNKKTGEIDPNTNNYINRYENLHYGNPYNVKAFNNDTYMMPAKFSKNGMSMNNQYINIHNPEDYCKYQIYDRYINDYKKENRIKNNFLRRSGNNLNANIFGYKYNNYRKKSLSSSTDNLFDYKNKRYYI